MFAGAQSRLHRHNDNSSQYHNFFSSYQCLDSLATKVRKRKWRSNMLGRRKSVEAGEPVPVAAVEKLAMEERMRTREEEGRRREGSRTAQSAGIFRSSVSTVWILARRGRYSGSALAAPGRVQRSTEADL